MNGFNPINASIKALTSPFSKSPEDIRSGDEVINTSFANVMQKYPTVESSSATSQIWNYFKYLEKPNGKQNVICILCAEKGVVKLLTKSTACAQHLGCAHADKLEGYRLNSTRSKYSSQAVKECKEQIAVAAARESSNQGNLTYYI